MIDAFHGKELPCFENFGKGNCECCLDALDCEQITFRLKHGVIVLKK